MDHGVLRTLLIMLGTQDEIPRSTAIMSSVRSIDSNLGGSVNDTSSVSSKAGLHVYVRINVQSNPCLILHECITRGSRLITCQIKA